jgi:cobalt-zinc-cadmium efflux system outer membrane protein
LSYEATILPRARKVAQMAELAYSKGAMSLTELIDARRTLRTILIEDIAARTDHAKAAQAWVIRQEERKP